MTLKEWCAVTGVSPTHPTTERGAVSLFGSGYPIDRELWNLDDYCVSSVRGVIMWLVPRPGYTENSHALSSRREEPEPSGFHEWRDTGGES